jgi:hypothetical protein
MIKEIIIYGSGCFSGIYLYKYISNKFGLLNNNSEKEKEKLFNYKKQLIFKENQLNKIPEKIKELISCPISLSFFRYPLISPHGITIENENIVRALKNHPLCPFTNQPLSLNDMRVNINIILLMKFLINREKYNKEHPEDEIKIEEIF